MIGDGCHQRLSLSLVDKNLASPFRGSPSLSPPPSLIATSSVLPPPPLPPQSPRRRELHLQPFCRNKGDHSLSRERKGRRTTEASKEEGKKKPPYTASHCFPASPCTARKKRCHPRKTAALPQQTPPSSSPRWARRGRPRTALLLLRLTAKPPPPLPRSPLRRRPRRSRRQRRSSPPAASPAATPASLTPRSLISPLLPPPRRRRTLR